MRLVALLVIFSACDSALNMSSGPLEKRTVESCPEALEHLRTCCPKYESYLSCTVLERWEGAGSADLTARQSRCLRKQDCATMEKAITSSKDLCGVTFRGEQCR